MTDQLPQNTVTISIPTNETDRLAALHRYKILDTPPEAAFDRITRLAARIFDMPTALISLVDESRAWFKSCVGFDSREVPRESTICSFAVLIDKPLIIPDTRKDDRFVCNFFVQSEPGVRFYAGAPLLSHDGFNLGTLCLLDTQPREALTAEQQATLVDLAAMVVDELELRLAAQKIAQVDAALLEITQGVAKVTGEAFFNALVQHFAKVLDADYAYIGLVEGDNPKMMKMIATCAHGQIVDNLEYILQDTPCWEVIEQGKICCYPRNVQAQFPNAPLLKPLEVESYIAIPFFDSSGTVLGLLGVMDGKPLENVQLAESLLTIFALRIATELERQQRDAALRESEAKYRTLFESIDEGFCICEMLFDESGKPQDYRFLTVNSAFEKITGFTCATGKTARELVPNLEARWVEICGRVVLTGEPIEYEKQSLAMNRWFNISVFPIDEAPSQKFGLLVSNISDRKAFEQERERFLAVSSDLQVLTRTDGYFKWVSPTFERVLGWTQEEMTSLPWTYFVHPEDITSSMYEIKRLLVGNETFAFENRYRHKDGSYRWLLWNAQPYPEEQVIYGAAVDITELKQAETALRESEAQSRNILESINDGFFALDENWQFTYVNQAAETLTNRSASELIGKIYWEEFPGVNSSEFEQMHRRTMRDRVATSLTAFYPDHNRCCEVNSYPAVNGITVFFRNVTEQIQAAVALRQSEYRYRTLFDSIDEGFCVIEMLFDQNNVPIDYRFLEANPAFEQQTGLQQAIGKTVRQLVPNLEKHWFEIYGKVALTGEPARFENQAEAMNRWFDVYAFPIEQPEHRKVAVLFKDITERKLAEAERERLLKQAQAAREEAENANRIKDEFLAVLSHELRSPLNPILGWSKLILSNKLDAAKTRQAMLTIERNAKLQSSLIEDLLDISRILQGKLILNITPVNLASKVHAAIETVRLAAEAKAITIETHLDTVGQVLGDSTRLQQVIWNLLSNAVKFTPAGGRVEVRLEQIDSEAQITVSDTGKGIPANFLPYVFEHFRQADSATTRKFGGLGLGLAIVRHLVELHGGTVWAQSPGEDLGATFTVRLPLMSTKTNRDSKGDTASDTPDLTDVQVLVVDDEADSRDLIAFVLEEGGAKVRKAASAIEAFSVLKQSKPDVLLSDIAMPDMDGYMLMQQVRSLPAEQGGKVAAIALTAYAGEFNKQQALQAGFQQHLAKPIEPNVLINTIASVINR